MVYLDYCATTPPSEAAVRAFTEAAAVTGNPNSVHSAGRKAKALIDDSTKNILDLLGAEGYELIYTSGATEANNLAFKGIFERYGNDSRNKIITTEFEHSSVIAPVSGLIGKGASLEFAPLGPDGTVDMEKLREMITEDTLMVSIGAVASETGIRQPVEEIGRMIKEDFPGVYFHSDITQAIGKCRVELENMDLASFSAHKFYGFKGIGGLIKKKGIVVMPQIQGGSSTTKFRSGTPPTELICSVSAALSDALSDFDSKEEYVRKTGGTIRSRLAEYEGVHINSPENAVPNIINFSVPGIRAEDTQKYFEDREIYFSTRTACSKETDYSKSVMSLTGNRQLAESSVRVSISYKTTEAETDAFLEAFGSFYEEVASCR